jgi:hypothetical protein
MSSASSMSVAAWHGGLDARCIYFRPLPKCSGRLDADIPDDVMHECRNVLFSASFKRNRVQKCILCTS